MLSLTWVFGMSCLGREFLGLVLSLMVVLSYFEFIVFTQVFENVLTYVDYLLTNELPK